MARRAIAVTGRAGRFAVIAALVATAVSAMPVTGAPAAAGTVTGAGDAATTATALRVDYRADPLGIGDTRPGLSWELRSPVPGERQTGYEIRAASSPDLLAAGKPDVWDSGHAASASSMVTWNGAALHSRERVYWQVRVWDSQDHPSAWSAPAYWEMGLLQPSDWSAQWIGNADWQPRQPTPAVVRFAATDARYVRLDVTKLGLPVKEGGFPYEVSRLQLAEVVVADSTQPGTDLALGAGVTASENYSVPGYWEPQYVTDGRLTTDQPPLGYTSYQRQSQDLGGSDIWLQIDLGQVRHFDEVELYPRTDVTTDDGQTPNFPVDYTIQTSADASTFTTAATVTNQAPPPPLHGQPAALPVFARQFALDGTVARARLYATGLGMYAATINGQPVSTGVLEPPETDYTKRVVYTAYDVTSLLRDGANSIGVMLGNGLYNVPPTPGRYEKLTRSDGPPKLLAQLEVTYTDGRTERVVTDSSWRSTLGPVTFTNWYGGEDFDARRVQPGWDQGGADLSTWQDAVQVTPPGPQTVLAARSTPPIQPAARITPVAITQPKPGDYVFDMGVNFAGWEQLHVSGPAGTTVTMRIGELLNPDGTVQQAGNGTGAPIWDSYTLSGQGAETWHPQFVYHGFRYLEVTGLPAPPTEQTVTGIELHTANPPAGSFSSSNQLLNSIHGIIGQAIANNMYSVLTDCPDREKLGWLEEDHLVFGSVSRNNDVAAYYRFLEQNMADAQTPDGLIPDIAPEYVVFAGGFRDDPNWGGTFILAPWQLYLTYGDVATLRAYFPAMQRYLSYLSGKAQDGILNYGLGDWVASDTSTPLAVTATYAYHQLAATMSDIASVLGDSAGQQNYAQLASTIATAFNNQFLDPAHGTYASGSQASDALALDMGIVPQQYQSAVLAHLIASIRAQGNHLTVGEIALPSVFRVLEDAGRDDVLYDVATQTTSPSYGYQVTHGATSLTELWDGPTAGQSQDHFMLGAIDEWFTSGLGGIRAAPGAVGYDRLVIAPAVVGDLTDVSASYGSVRGPISTRWTRQGRQLQLDVTVPAGTTATVLVPVDPSHPVASQGHGFQEFQGDHAVYDIGSGSYSFESQLPA